MIDRSNDLVGLAGPLTGYPGKRTARGVAGGWRFEYEGAWGL